MPGAPLAPGTTVPAAQRGSVSNTRWKTQPRFLQNKGLVVLILTTLLCTVVLAFVHRFVPVILVSIVDDIGALIFAIVASWVDPDGYGSHTATATPHGY